MDEQMEQKIRYSRRLSSFKILTICAVAVFITLIFRIYNLYDNELPVGIQWHICTFEGMMTDKSRDYYMMKLENKYEERFPEHWAQYDVFRSMEVGETKVFYTYRYRNNYQYGDYYLAAELPSRANYYRLAWMMFGSFLVFCEIVLYATWWWRYRVARADKLTQRKRNIIGKIIQIGAVILLGIFFLAGAVWWCGQAQISLEKWEKTVNESRLYRGKEENLTIAGLDNADYPLCKIQYNNSTKTVTVKKNAGIERYRFDRCVELKDVVFEDSVDEDVGVSFSQCIHLEKVKLPAGLHSVEDYTFEGCTQLKEIYMPAEITTISSVAFKNCNEDFVIVTPAGSYAEQYAIENNITYRNQAE